jgi:hypothetical protein
MPNPDSMPPNNWREHGLEFIPFVVLSQIWRRSNIEFPESLKDGFKYHIRFLMDR